MKVYRSLAEYEKSERTLATMGTFDGIHLGHKALLNRIRTEAEAVGGETLLITFDPHPRLVLFPENNPLRLLQTLEEKIETLSSYGLDKLLIIPFTKEFSRIPSHLFIKEILAEGVGMRKIIIGYDHRFGKNRTGGVEELQQFAPQYGYEVEEIPARTIDDINISSSKIRKALTEGDVTAAQRFLGYAYSFSGTVIHGEKQGRLLGYPTANLAPEDPLKLIPGDGIYFVRALVGGQWYYGMMSIGKKPTMGEFARGYEVNLFDFEGDIYGQVVRVEFLEWIRGEKKFDSLEALIAAIDGDKAFCMERIGV
ncbi:MAG: bifunctional riboflavin kinase/FAD synthetase [Bacteroidetes bacterium]|nr:MAG: bifunctional riboflavin kinase/FAD synthetase [Bacteroidota bacterium]